MKQSHNRIRACCVFDQKWSGPLSVLCDFQWQGHAGEGMDQEGGRPDVQKVDIFLKVREEEEVEVGKEK